MRNFLIRMSSIICSIGVFAAASFVFFYVYPESAASAPISNVCYIVPDLYPAGMSDKDALQIVDTASPPETTIGLTGTFSIETIALNPITKELFAIDKTIFGKIDVNTGVYTAIRDFKANNIRGDQGTINLDDIDSLAFDVTTGNLYAASITPLNLLIQLDSGSGHIVKNAFGAGVDYVSLSNTLDDIAISYLTGEMYGIDVHTEELVAINKLTGAATVVGIVPYNDVEGLSFATDDILYGSTGKNDTISPNTFLEIDKTNATATKVMTFTSGSDYESLECLAELIVNPSADPYLRAYDGDVHIRDGMDDSIVRDGEKVIDRKIGIEGIFSAENPAGIPDTVSTTNWKTNTTFQMFQSLPYSLLKSRSGAVDLFSNDWTQGGNYIYDGLLVVPNSGVTITSGTYLTIFTGDRDIVIDGNIIVEEGAFLLLATSGGDVVVDGDVTDVQGMFYLEGGLFDTGSGSNNELNIEGMIIADSIELGRDLLTGNATEASEEFYYRPSFLFFAPDFLKARYTIWEEVNPGN
jgi:hypothetical protein